jgi:hypothetical protein
VLAAVAASGSLCPPGAGALGVGGLGSVCQVVGGVAGLAGSAASQVTGFGVDSVLGALGSWVAEGAVWLLDQVGAVLTSTTSIDLGASWFTEHYETMAALCGVVVLPMLLLGVIQAIYRQDLSMLLRSVLVNVPLAMLLTAVAVKLVQLGLAVTDELSSAVAQGAGLDAGHFMAAVTTALSGGAASQPAVPAFIVFLGGLVVVVGAFLVWIELLIRAAAVYVAVLFLPLALASLAWPAIAHWCRRLVDTLVALILGKFVIVSVLSLAASALDAGTGTGTGTGTGEQSGGSFAAVLGGAALLLLAAFAPWALFRLLPFLEAGAVAHLEGLSQRARRAATVPTRGLAQTALRAATSAAVGGGSGLLLGAAAGASGSTGSTGSAAGPQSRPPGRPGSGAGERARLGVGDLTERGPSDGDATDDNGGPHSGPGAGIPRWEPDAEMSEVLGRWQLDEAGVTAGSSGGTLESRSNAWATAPIPAVATVGGVSAPSPAGLPRAAPGASSWAPGPVPLPRQTGVRLVDGLERDELGVRLVSRSLPPGSGTDG